jgi:glutamyl-tRNA synthetase
MSTSDEVRVRFAPSPTGRFHIGGARTALYDFLLARQRGGQFILRIEDTDRKRYVPAAEQEIMDGLHWLGMQWDEGPDVGGPCAPYRQSERTAIYKRLAQELVERGSAYYCFCSPQRLHQVRLLQQKRKEPPRYDGLCRQLSPDDAQARVRGGEPHVIRFKTPQGGRTGAIDLLRGTISVDNSALDDFILLKSDGLPVYHLAAMADDHLMGITHVLRGSEWLPTFPLHVLIYRAFEWPEPIWVHLSVFLNPSGKGKLSKRDAALSKDGVVAIFTLDLQKLGYLPEAVVNWIALMGWSYDDHTERFTMQELVEKFSLERLNPSAAAVDFGKLDHFNAQYIRSLSTEELMQRIRPFLEASRGPIDTETLRKITPLIQERIRTLEEAESMAGFFFREHLEVEAAQLVGNDMTESQSAEAVRRAAETIETLPDMSPAIVEPALRSLAEEMGLSAGQLFGILRMAVTGQRVSPPLIESMEVIGKEKTLARLEVAARLLEAPAPHKSSPAPQAGMK